jgi:hypothetical protein
MNTKFILVAGIIFLAGCSSRAQTPVPIATISVIADSNIAKIERAQPQGKPTFIEFYSDT